MTAARGQTMKRGVERRNERRQKNNLIKILAICSTRVHHPSSCLKHITRTMSSHKSQFILRSSMNRKGSESEMKTINFDIGQCVEPIWTMKMSFVVPNRVDFLRAISEWLIVCGTSESTRIQLNFWRHNFALWSIGLSRLSNKLKARIDKRVHESILH